MKKKHIKIRERKDSRYKIEILEIVLFFLGFIPILTLSRSSSNREWFNKELILIGVGDLWGYGSWIPIIIGVSLCLLALRLAKNNKIKLQPLRDNEATLNIPQALYLRPFFTDLKTSFPNPFHSTINTALSANISMEPKVLGAEEFLGRVLEPYINVREVEGSNETIGLGRVRVSAIERWQSVVIKTIMEAPLIIVLPLLSQLKKSNELSGVSTMWELEQLVKLDRIDCTIAIMPNSDWRDRKLIRESWENARSKASEFGLILPEYYKKGCVIIFERKDNDWQPLEVFGKAGFGQKRLARGLIEAFMYQVERLSK